MKDAGPIWEEIVNKHGLRKTSVEELAPWWFLDATLGRPIEAVNDMNKVCSLKAERISKVNSLFS